MRTDDLITLLAADGPRGGGSLTGRMAGAAALGTLLSAVCLFVFVGIRPDLMSALRDPAVFLKFAFTGTLAAAGFVGLRALARPESVTPLGALVWPGLLVLGAGLGAELLLTAPAQWRAAAMGKTPYACLALVTLSAIMPVGAILVALRRAAPRSPAEAGAGAGLVGGAAGAFMFALTCPNDSALFVAIWYVAALAFVTAVAALLGRRLLAW